MQTTDFEKLGSFYLGREYDPDAKRRGEGLVLYDSKDLVTHAVCVGMTGSGKTGLCLSLLEEAAIDGVPAIVIDPKGDLGNLLLTFPDLRGEDFLPWVNAEDAKKKGLDTPAFAQQQADLWKKGLGEWGQDGARIKRFRDAADLAIYTPGSSAGLPVSILKSFAAPSPDEVEDAEAFRERVTNTSSGLLSLLNIEADPLQSREHILLSTILEHAWRGGEDIDIAAIIGRVQTPPVKRIGVMDVDTIYPPKDRFALAMALNNLIAAPGFSAFVEGEPLDISAMLRAADGRPRISIFSIAHLSDSERMFFVSLLMTQILAWTRTQSGTTSLRAIIYMDEIAGYFPPVANPPSKQPMLTLMKQARAFGVGMMLATQNPVDLDYKGLANAGTWFIGRLQTERDKARVLDGLEGAAAQASSGFDRKSMDALLSKLGSRVFLLNNVHEDAPVVFETRWAMSYLRGPLTRSQIKMLMDPRRASNGDSKLAAKGTTSMSGVGDPVANGARVERQVLPSDVPQYFIPTRAAPGATIVYRPMVLGIARVFYSDSKLGIDIDQPVSMLATIGEGPVAVDWSQAKSTDLTEADIEKEPASGAGFAPLPPEAAQAKAYAAWGKSFADSIFRSTSLALLRSAILGEVSRVGESERDFRSRIQQSAREQRDAAIEKLRQKYAPKLAALQDRIRRAEQTVDVQKQQARNAKMQTAVSFGSVVLGALLGRKKLSATTVSRAGTAMKGAGRASKESGDVGRAEDNVDALRQQAATLEADCKADIDALILRLDPTTEALETVTIKPKKANITVRTVVLAWAPHVVDTQGVEASAW